MKSVKEQRVPGQRSRALFFTVSSGRLRGGLAFNSRVAVHEDFVAVGVGDDRGLAFLSPRGGPGPTSAYGFVSAAFTSAAFAGGSFEGMPFTTASPCPATW